MKTLVELVQQYPLEVIALAKLIVQNKPSMDEGLCLYRGPEGVCCGIGHLIDNDNYDSSLESSCADSVGVIDAVCASIGRSLNPGELDKLIDVQEAHDFTDLGKNKKLTFLEALNREWVGDTNDNIKSWKQALELSDLLKQDSNK